jgi:hypothetical protein
VGLCLSLAGRNLTAFTILSEPPQHLDTFCAPHCSYEATDEHNFHLPMLISKLQYRFALVATILVLVALGLLFKTKLDFIFGLQLGNESNEPNKPNDLKAWIYSAPEAEDKAVVLAKVHSEDVNWVFDHLQEYATQNRLYGCLYADEGRPVGNKQYTIWMNQVKERFIHHLTKAGRLWRISHSSSITTTFFHHTWSSSIHTFKAGLRHGIQIATITTKSIPSGL